MGKMWSQTCPAALLRVLVALSSPKEWALAQLPREWWSQRPWRCSTTLEMWHGGDVVGGHCEDGLGLGLVISEVISNLYDSIRTSSWRPTRCWGQQCLQCWILHWVGRVSEQLHPSFLPAPSCSQHVSVTFCTPLQLFGWELCLAVPALCLLQWRRKMRAKPHLLAWIISH